MTVRTRVILITQIGVVAAAALAWVYGLLDWLSPWALPVLLPYLPGIAALTRRRSVEFHAEFALVLGMAGTVVGLVVMVSGIEPGAVRQIDSAVLLVAQALVGLGIALHTTLVGIAVWVALVVQDRALRSL